MPTTMKVIHALAVAVLIMILLAGPVAPPADAGPEDLPRGHRQITGVVTQKGGGLVVTTPAGATHQLNPNLSQRHGHQPFKAGDEVTAVLDENNYIVDMHLKGQKGTHQLITGTLVHVGKTKKEIKLQTPEGEKVFALVELGLKTKDLPNGTLVTVEVNEAGIVIDLHQADIGTGKN
jgi:hypothetical protein